MPKIIVEIEWDQPNERFWLNPDNISLALHSYCKNTKFQVHEPKIVEQCAKRIEAYALSLEVQQHIGLPNPIAALEIVAQKVRELSIEAK